MFSLALIPYYTKLTRDEINVAKINAKKINEIFFFFFSSFLDEINAISRDECKILEEINAKMVVRKKKSEIHGTSKEQSSNKMS